jgi:hypothetical protein
MRQGVREGHQLQEILSFFNYQSKISQNGNLQSPQKESPGIYPGDEFLHNFTFFLEKSINNNILKVYSKYIKT